MRITPYGAAGEVTGSCYLLEVGDLRLLLDCGLIQGSQRDEERNFDPFPFDPSRIDAVVLSHAHLDHCGRLPLLVQRGFRGTIHTQSATADLLRVMLQDAASIAAYDAERANRHRRAGAPLRKPLYDLDDVAETLRYVRGHEYEVETRIGEHVVLRLHDAGHILGSAIVDLQSGGRRIVFSGDLGMPGTPILRDPQHPLRADRLLLESTYGDRMHRLRTETVVELGELFAQAWEDGGNVLIPAFAVGRTQELLYWFAQHWDDWGLGRWQIFLDSPMALKVIEIYQRHHDLFDKTARALWNGRRNPFRLPNLHLVSEVAQSQAINRLRGGAIILAGSGMCNGGRIRHHLRQNLGRRNAHVVFVGYQARGTLGRQLVDHAREVHMFGEAIQVKAQVHTIGGLSAHADQVQLLNWYGRFENRPPVTLVHGEDGPRAALRERLIERFACAVDLAAVGQPIQV